MRRAALLVAAALAVLLALAPAAGARTRTGPGCDPLGEGIDCLFPWPNDFFTRPDASSATGRRLALTDAQMPRNAQGVPIASADYDASDGFSPGQTIVVKVPGFDTPAAFARTGAVPLTDLARTYDRDQPVVVLDARTGRRQLIWAELDANASTPADTTLLIHPAQDWTEGHRYVVALRDLRGADGRRLPAGPAFRRYRDGIPTADRAFERRRAHMESLFRTLGRAGIPRALAEPGLGLHRGQRPLADPADALDPRPRVRRAAGTATSPTSASGAAPPRTRSTRSPTTPSPSSRTWPAASRAT